MKSYSCSSLFLGKVRPCLSRFLGLSDCGSVSCLVTSGGVWATRTTPCTVQLFGATDKKTFCFFFIKKLFNKVAPLQWRLTFQILFMLAHCPHTDFIVDQVDARKAELMNKYDLKNWSKLKIQSKQNRKAIISSKLIVA